MRIAGLERPSNSFERKMSKSESDRLVNARLAALGYSDSDYSGSGGGNLTNEILNSVTQLGSAAILANSRNSGVVQPMYSDPVYRSAPPMSRSNGGSLLLFGLLIAVGAFAYTKL